MGEYTWVFVIAAAIFGTVMGYRDGYRDGYGVGHDGGICETLRRCIDDLGRLPTPKPFSERDMVKELEEYMSRPETIARNEALFEKSKQAMDDYLDNSHASNSLLNEVDEDWEDEHGEDK